MERFLMLMLVAKDQHVTSRLNCVRLYVILVPVYLGITCIFRNNPIQLCLILITLNVCTWVCLYGICLFIFCLCLLNQGFGNKQNNL